MRILNEDSVGSVNSALDFLLELILLERQCQVLIIMERLTLIEASSVPGKSRVQVLFIAGL